MQSLSSPMKSNSGPFRICRSRAAAVSVLAKYDLTAESASCDALRPRQRPILWLLENRWCVHGSLPEPMTSEPSEIHWVSIQIIPISPKLLHFAPFLFRFDAFHCNIEQVLPNIAPFCSVSFPFCFVSLQYSTSPSQNCFVSLCLVSLWFRFHWQNQKVNKNSFVLLGSPKETASSKPTS